MAIRKTKTIWFLYIIRTKRGRYYTGITTDLKRRYEQHISGKGAKFFRIDPPQEIVYSERCGDRSKASKREIFIKKLDRKAKEKIFINE